VPSLHAILRRETWSERKRKNRDDHCQKY